MLQGGHEDKFLGSISADASSFLSHGWVLPNHYPTISSDSAWLMDVQVGTYRTERYPKGKCIAQLMRTSEACRHHIMSGFWWGESMRVSEKVSRIAEEYLFSLITPSITLYRMISTDIEEDIDPIDLPHAQPPKPWRLQHYVKSNLNISGTLLGLKTGFFWFKPLLWAIHYHIHQKDIHLNLTSTSQITYIYPIVRSSSIEGIVGFSSSDSHRISYIPPSHFDFFPADIHPISESTIF
ncbi:hypothetical protein DSO57_1021575 [Entomophthora muscae]|uniref:Uncharacterized protein n=1 Tax=Entomophthora muscae TaxID=34485 RepID=A0ACC2SSD1_9FUNG|nr:hypothetical protein DSO57_1021575 [Entomophthora muscae]